MLVFGLTSANQPLKLLGLWPARSLCLSWDLDVRCWTLGVFQTVALAALRLISEALLVPMRLHAFAAFMLGNFRLASFLKRAHSVFQIRESRLNHQIRCNAN